jgi:hypothetical protein
VADTIQSEELGPVFVGGQAPEQLHKAQFGYDGPWGENSALKRAHEVSGSFWDRLNALHEYRVNRNPEVEPAVHARKVAKLVEEFGRERASQWDSVKADLKRERGRVEDELKRGANLKANLAHFNAIVGTFGTLSPEQRMAAIDQAISEGDGPTLATLLEAPSLVTGLTAEQRESIKVRTYERASPSGHALLKQLEKALVRAEAASIAAITATQKLAQGTDRYDRHVEQAKALEAKLTVH